MIVAELVARLTELPDDAEVVIADEDGLDVLRDVDRAELDGAGRVVLGSGWEGL